MISSEKSPKFRVVLFSERGLDKNLAGQVHDLFARHPGPVSVEVGGNDVEIPKAGPDGSLLWADIFTVLCQLRESNAIECDTFVYLLTKTHNENYWYATEDKANMRNCFGHVSEFRWLTSAPIWAVSAHFILKSIFNETIEKHSAPCENFWHEEPEGCFFDFCEYLPDLRLKLRTADICGDCIKDLREMGVPDNLFRQTVAIMETTRTSVIRTGQYRVAEPGFEHWPFPVAVTRRKAEQQINPLLRFLQLLDHFDSLVRYFYLAREVVSGRKPGIKERPSLGWWVDQLAQSLKGEKYFRDVVAIAENEKVVKLRNEKRGHGYMPPSDESFRYEADRLVVILGDIERDLTPFFQKYQLVIPRRLDLCGGKYVLEGERLQGSHPLHLPFSATLKDDPRAAGILDMNKVHLTEGNMEKFHPMFPYITNETCPECKHPRVLITDGGRTYIDVFMGHRVELNPPCL